MTYINDRLEVKELDETMKVFIRVVRWRLTQNDCQNRGYILENFPNFTSELIYIFNKLSDKKLKRKKPKVLPAVIPKASEQSIGSEG
jgi:adenylate kinase